MNNRPVLEVENLSVHGDKIPILDKIHWKMEPGQHWVILGSNGSGKTSLLNALCGYLMPTTGKITVLGNVYGESDWRDLRTRIGLVSSGIRQRINDQELPVEIVVSGRYAMLNTWGEVKQSDRRRAMKLLDQAGCKLLALRPWALLSQGERQRILIARALMARPEILILDEPCAGLDPLARHHFLVFMEKLAQNPASPSLVFVTHHVEEITPSFDQVLLLKKGRVLRAGPKTKILNARNLSETFNAPVRLRRHKSLYFLSF